MTCAECRALLPDYADSVLAADRQAEVKRHLEQCAECAELHRQLSPPSRARTAPAGAAERANGEPAHVSGPEEQPRKGLIGGLSLIHVFILLGGGGLVLAASILLQLEPDRGYRLAVLDRGSTKARIYDIREGQWQAARERRTSVQHGNRIMVPEPPGAQATLSVFRSKVRLEAPAAVQIELHGDSEVWLHLLPEQQGRIRIEGGVPAGSGQLRRSLRLCVEQAWVKLDLTADTDAMVERIADDQVRVTVYSGGALTGNKDGTQRVLPGFRAVAPQNGSPPHPQFAPRGAPMEKVEE